MNRIDRLSAILIQLQSKRRVPLLEIERRFEIGRRTAFRDIKALIAAGVPIGGDAGQGYFIVEGYHLPAVVFSKEEAAALLLASKVLSPRADSKTSHFLEEALFKVKSVLRFSDKDYLQNLEGNVRILDAENSKTSDSDDFFQEIQHAVAEHRVFEMEYFSNYNQTLTKRRVAPLGLVYYNSHWHLIGYCFKREQIRDFRTSRVRSLVNLGEYFDPADYPNYHDFLEEQSSRYETLEVSLEIHNDITRYIKDSKYQYGFVSEIEREEWTEMKFMTPDLHYVARWIIMQGKYVKVVAPTDLKEIVQSLCQELFEHYQLPHEIRPF